jgi:hypothetical protein
MSTHGRPVADTTVRHVLADTTVRHVLADDRRLAERRPRSVRLDRRPGA